MMQIEKISRFIHVSVNGSAVYDNGLTQRRVLMSLPRVKWLERDGDSSNASEQKYLESREAVPSYVRQKITPREQEALDKRRSGMKMVEIADSMGITVKGARGYVLAARRKERYKKSDYWQEELN